MRRLARRTGLPRGTASVALLLVGCLHARDRANAEAPSENVRDDGLRERAATAPQSSAGAPSTAVGATREARRDGTPATPGELRLLAVSGFEDAVVAVPRHEHAVPLLVATHGAGGDSRWECERW